MDNAEHSRIICFTRIILSGKPFFFRPGAGIFLFCQPGFIYRSSPILIVRFALRCFYRYISKSVISMKTCSFPADCIKNFYADRSLPDISQTAKLWSNVFSDLLKINYIYKVVYFICISMILLDSCRKFAIKLHGFDKGFISLNTKN